MGNSEEMKDLGWVEEKKKYIYDKECNVFNQLGKEFFLHSLKRLLLKNQLLVTSSLYTAFHSNFLYFFFVLFEFLD